MKCLENLFSCCLISVLRGSKLVRFGFGIGLFDGGETRPRRSGFTGW